MTTQKTLTALTVLLLAASSAAFAETVSAQVVNVALSADQPQNQEDGQKLDRVKCNPLAPLAGAGLGALAGNQFGHGKGRIATTIAGGLLGAGAGASLGCHTVPGNVDYRNQNTLFLVTLAYHGQAYTETLNYQPDIGSVISLTIPDNDTYANEQPPVPNNRPYRSWSSN